MTSAGVIRRRPTPAILHPLTLWLPILSAGLPPFMLLVIALIFIHHLIICCHGRLVLADLTNKGRMVASRGARMRHLTRRGPVHTVHRDHAGRSAFTFPPTRLSSDPRRRPSVLSARKQKGDYIDTALLNRMSPFIPTTDEPEWYCVSVGANRENSFRESLIAEVARKGSLLEERVFDCVYPTRGRVNFPATGKPKVQLKAFEPGRVYVKALMSPEVYRELLRMRFAREVVGMEQREVPRGTDVTQGSHVFLQPEPVPAHEMETTLALVENGPILSDGEAILSELECGCYVEIVETQDSVSKAYKGSIGLFDKATHLGDEPLADVWLPTEGGRGAMYQLPPVAMRRLPEERVPLEAQACFEAMVTTDPASFHKATVQRLAKSQAARMEPPESPAPKKKPARRNGTKNVDSDRDSGPSAADVMAAVPWAMATPGEAPSTPDTTEIPTPPVRKEKEAEGVLKWKHPPLHFDVLPQRPLAAAALDEPPDFFPPSPFSQPSSGSIDVPLSPPAPSAALEDEDLVGSDGIYSMALDDEVPLRRARRGRGAGGVEGQGTGGEVASVPARAILSSSDATVDFFTGVDVSGVRTEPIVVSRVAEHRVDLSGVMDAVVEQELSKGNPHPFETETAVAARKRAGGGQEGGEADDEAIREEEDYDIEELGLDLPPVVKRTVAASSAPPHPPQPSPTTDSDDHPLLPAFEPADVDEVLVQGMIMERDGRPSQPSLPFWTGPHSPMEADRFPDGDAADRVDALANRETTSFDRAYDDIYSAAAEVVLQQMGEEMMSRKPPRPPQPQQRGPVGIPAGRWPTEDTDQQLETLPLGRTRSGRGSSWFEDEDEDLMHLYDDEMLVRVNGDERRGMLQWQGADDLPGGPEGGWRWEVDEGEGEGTAAAERQVEYR
ncbi:unnamed protein product [Vitrella brassicaformis CCMP3155]|uniref:Uncharacterized protein n=2 Tax=Vitrella brassicaformis TaxID=1169539 RepID=A0A0G4FBV3_VITBC|nr:unnamed protein product [Vitrella brassicaformis CCMP3155]|eukprot:CEM10686.1 unnamed protein product [Vitrella brassicaformis CCMP3155]